MNIVKIPLLNLEFNISKIAFSIGNINIYWYAIFIVFALILSLIIFKVKNGKFNIKFSDVIDLCIYIIPISLVCARIYYVLFNLEYYIKNPIEIFNVKSGGLAIYGAIIGGVVTCYVFCKKRKIDLLDLLDYIVPCLALGQSIGRWGNFVNVEAYGIPTQVPWRMGIYEAGKYIEVHPTFLYESIITFILFIILTLISNKRKYKGQVTLIYLMIYSFARVIIEGLRTDSLMLGSIRISQLLSLIIFISTSIGLCRMKILRSNH